MTDQRRRGGVRSSSPTCRPPGSNRSRGCVRSRRPTTTERVGRTPTQRTRVRPPPRECRSADYKLTYLLSDRIQGHRPGSPPLAHNMCVGIRVRSSGTLSRGLSRSGQRLPRSSRARTVEPDAAWQRVELEAGIRWPKNSGEPPARQAQRRTRSLRSGKPGLGGLP